MGVEQDTKLQDVINAYEKYAFELQTAVHSQGPVFVALLKDWETATEKRRLFSMVTKNSQEWRTKRDPAIKAAKTRLMEAKNAAGITSSPHHGRAGHPTRGRGGERRGRRARPY